MITRLDLFSAENMTVFATKRKAEGFGTPEREPKQADNKPTPQKTVVIEAKETAPDEVDVKDLEMGMLALKQYAESRDRQLKRDQANELAKGMEEADKPTLNYDRNHHAIKLKMLQEKKSALLAQIEANNSCKQLKTLHQDTTHMEFITKNAEMLALDKVLKSEDLPIAVLSTALERSLIAQIECGVATKEEAEEIKQEQLRNIFSIEKLEESRNNIPNGVRERLERAQQSPNDNDNRNNDKKRTSFPLPTLQELCREIPEDVKAKMKRPPPKPIDPANRTHTCNRCGCSSSTIAGGCCVYHNIKGECGCSACKMLWSDTNKRKVAEMKLSRALNKWAELDDAMKPAELTKQIGRCIPADIYAWDKIDYNWQIGTSTCALSCCKVTSC